MKNRNFKELIQRVGIQERSQYYLNNTSKLKILQMQEFMRNLILYYLCIGFPKKVENRLLKFVQSVHVSGCGYDTLINNTLPIAS